jgi:pilus assembly protein CpaF
MNHLKLLKEEKSNIMTWEIINKKTQEILYVPNESILSIGNLPECEIQTSPSKTRSLECQIILEDHFIFSTKKNQISIFFNSHTCTFNNDHFTFSSAKNAKLENPTYSDLTSIFNSKEYISLLQNVQNDLSKNRENHPVIRFSADEVISLACSILSQSFWNLHPLFKKESRGKFKILIWCVWAQICEYGILTLALNDSNVSEIMVNSSQQIYLERNGKLSISPLSFANDQELLAIIERICSSMGRRIDESMPYCDARLKDGSRIHAIIPPLALNGPCLTIRKFPKHSITAEKLVEMKSIPQENLNFLAEIVRFKKNILISGGTGSGKTTLLNCLSMFIPNDERIITIEDSAELKLQQDHVIRLESRAENIENKGSVSMRDLVKNSLRMRPDRIIVGECRGGEALDMLQAMNTGHDGSMTTVHANTPADALRRLETLVLFAEYDLPSRAIREQITSAIQYVIQQSRLANGHRCVTAIHEITGLCQTTGQFLTKSLYEY